MRTPIYYTNFSDWSVFEDPELNVFVNQIFTTLINQLDEATVKSELVLDGEVALILQDEIATVSRIRFSIYSAKVFRMLQASVSAWSAKDVVITDRRVTMKFKSQIFEISKVGKPIKASLYHGIYMKGKVDILNEQ